MRIVRHVRLAAALLPLAFGTGIAAEASPLDGIAGAAVGFALGSMSAPQPQPPAVVVAPRTERVIIYRDRQPAPRRHVAKTHKRGPSPTGGAAISASADPFAGSASTKPVPVNDH